MASKALRWTARIGAGLVGLAVLAIAAIFFLSERALGDTGEPRDLRLAVPTAQQLADAPRMLTVNGCVGCHGDGLTGKQFHLDPKVATLYSPNLTRLAARVDDATLDRAIRGGVGHDGRALVIMPSAGYHAMTGQEVAALIAAIRALPVGGTETPARKVGPLGRIGLATGQFTGQPAMVAHYAANPLPDLGPATAKGRHFAAVNCADCHGADLKGKTISPTAISVDLNIVGAYDLAQFTTLLRTGVPPSNKDLGLMGAVAREDFRHFTDEEIAALHAYLVAHANR